MRPGMLFILVAAIGTTRALATEIRELSCAPVTAVECRDGAATGQGFAVKNDCEFPLRVYFAVRDKTGTGKSYDSLPGRRVAPGRQLRHCPALPANKDEPFRGFKVIGAGRFPLAPSENLLASLASNNQTQEVQRSRALIDHFLNWTYAVDPAAKLPTADRVQRALREVTNLREQPGNSTNIQLRNAEYYLHGLYAAISGDTDHLMKAKTVAVYDTMKGLAQQIGMTVERLLRANPDNPTSPPGGAPWAYVGIEDGEKIRNSETFGRTQGHGLQLTLPRNP